MAAIGMYNLNLIFPMASRMADQPRNRWNSTEKPMIMPAAMFITISGDSTSAAMNPRFISTAALFVPM